MRWPLLKPVTLVAAILTGLQSVCSIFDIFQNLNLIHVSITDWLRYGLIPTLAWISISLFFFVLYSKQQKI